MEAAESLSPSPNRKFSPLCLNLGGKKASRCFYFVSRSLVPGSCQLFTHPAQGSPVMTSTSTPTHRGAPQGGSTAGWDGSPDLLAPLGGLPHLCFPWALPKPAEVSPGATFLSLGGTCSKDEGPRTCHSGVSSDYSYRRMSLPHSPMLLPMNQSLSFFLPLLAALEFPISPLAH